MVIRFGTRALGFLGLRRTYHELDLAHNLSFTGSGFRPIGAHTLVPEYLCQIAGCCVK